MFKLKCAVQNYDWGQKGSESLVAKIHSANGGNVLEDKKYAEYWMGTHLNGTSQIDFLNFTLNLAEYVKDKLGLNDGLPFLFKILSIKDPLSIQLHPDKQMAESLHKEEPEHYKDPNHKPEMAIVLSDSFEMFYGLLNLGGANELLSILYPYFKTSQSDSFLKCCESFLDVKTDESYKNFLRELILLKDEEFKPIIRKLNESIEELSHQNKDNQNLIKKLLLFKNLHNIFKEDRGILFSLFMNYLKLKQGDYIFINANVPHAYIRGDCAECMANSDNVIRLGLTPKFVDTKNFLKILEKEFESMSDNSLNDNIKPIVTENLVIYSNPKYDDFKVSKLTLNNKQDMALKIENFSILFVYCGSFSIKDVTYNQELQVNQYETYFVTKNTELKIQNTSDYESIIFIATF